MTLEFNRPPVCPYCSNFWTCDWRVAEEGKTYSCTRSKDHSTEMLHVACGVDDHAIVMFAHSRALPPLPPTVFKPVDKEEARAEAKAKRAAKARAARLKSDRLFDI